MFNPIRLVKAAIAKHEEEKALRQAELDAAHESAARFDYVSIALRHMSQRQLAGALNSGSLQMARAQFDIDLATIRRLSK